MGNDKAVIEQIRQPVYYLQPVDNDEIDLVGLCLKLLAMRKKYLATLLILVALGAIAITLLYEDKVQVRSVIDIRPMTIGGSRMDIDSPNSVVSTVEVSILPRLIISANENPAINYLKRTEASNPAGSDLVAIDSVVPVSLVGEVKNLHQSMISAVMLKFQRKVDFVHKTISTEIATRNLRLAKLAVEQKILEQEFEERANAIQESVPDSTAGELLDSLRYEIGYKKGLILTEIEFQKAKIEQFNFELENTGPVVLQQATVGEFVGISKTVSYVLWFLLSVILAVFVMMAFAFVDNLRTRHADKA